VTLTHSPETGRAYGITALNALAERLPEDRYGAGEYLFREATPLEDVFVVRQGVIGLGRHTNGRRLTFQLLRMGDIVGDVAALRGGVALFDAFAVTETRVVAIPASGFLEALDLRSTLTRQWAMGLGERITALQTRLEEALGGHLRSRLCTLLHHQLQNGSPVVHLTQQTIAELLGVPRTSVTRVLQGLQRQGIIDIGYGHIAILDRAAVAAESG
jgi:CRP-like cAMP-binding protein